MPRALPVDGDELVRFPTPTAAKAAAQSAIHISRWAQQRVILHLVSSDESRIGW